MNVVFNETINESDELLKKWISDITGISTITFNLPGTTITGTEINAYLFKISRSQIRDTLLETPVQIIVHYVLSVWGDDMTIEHQLLTRLVFGALQNPEWETNFPLENNFFKSTFGIGAKPCCVIAIPVMQKRKMPSVKMVEKPLVIQSAFRCIVNGLLLQNEKGAGSMRVLFPEINVSTLTSADGTFSMSVVPANLRIDTLRESITVEDSEGNVNTIHEIEVKETINSLYLTITLED